jgi:GDP-4-dehydro-6-deoxy-D-mannose reductase
VARIAAGRQEPVLQVGALDPFRDFLDVRDVCDAYIACLNQAETLPSGTAFNIAAGSPRRVGDVLQNLLDLAGIEATIQTGTALLRPSEIPLACGNASLARKLLHWEPRIPWTDTLQSVLADWQNRVANEVDSSTQ